jgi:ferric iron reductase protein FhuF
MSERNTDSGVSENFEFLINELTKGQGQLREATNDLVSAVNSSTFKVDILQNSIGQLINEKFKGFETLLEQKMVNSKNVNQQADTNSLQAALKKSIVDLRLMLSTYPKGITKKFQILLFPEQDAKLFYKIVFGRWFMWLAMMLALVLLYKSTIHYIDSHKQVMLEIEQNDRIRKSWNYLYDQANKKGKRQMDSVFILIDLNTK